ncbi:class I SAM-dependent methyltransferase, partial [Thermogemmatispora tikiterensis]|uniref:class I SAM-dependent methyltransferase n=1 Tax=Thermogemmatispora tikiterensis TaxID=1825093 RepID=UPI001672DB27
MIEYARTQAWSRGLEHIHFQVLNVMEPLAFPDGEFDLINGRLLSECYRLLTPGGVLHLTEVEPPPTTSPVFERHSALESEALRRAGQSWSPDGRHIGITPVLPRLVRQAGF